MPGSRKQMYSGLDIAMNAMPAQMIESVDHEILLIVIREPVKEVAKATDLDERYIKALRYREIEQPNTEARVKFGFAYPSVGEVWAYWSRRMTEPTLFDHEEQRRFHRDYSRAGRSSDG